MAADDPAPDWLVDGLLASGGLSLVAGRPKSGKSTLARAAVVAVVQGREFLGCPVRQGAALLVSLEDRKRDVGRHLRGLGLRPDDPLLVATAGDALRVQRWVADHRPALVVLDTVGRLLKIREANEYGHVLDALDGALRLARQSGAHVMLVHHAPKASDGRDPIDAPLGSTAFAGSADSLIHVKRLQDGTRTIATVQRVGEDLPESILTIGSDGWPTLGGTRSEQVLRQDAEAVLTFLAAQGAAGASRQDVLAGVGGNAQATLRALSALVAEGRVTQTGDGRRGSPFRFAVLPFWGVERNSRTETEKLPKPSSETPRTKNRSPFQDTSRNGGTETRNRLEPAPDVTESHSWENTGPPLDGERNPVPGTESPVGDAPVQRRARRRAAGLCEGCGGPVLPGLPCSRCHRSGINADL